MNILQIVEVIADTALSFGSNRVINMAAKKLLPAATSKTDILLTKLGIGAINFVVDYNIAKAVHEMICPEPTKAQLVDIINNVGQAIETTDTVLEKVTDLQIKNSIMTEHLVKLSMSKSEYSDYMRDFMDGGAMNG